MPVRPEDTARHLQRLEDERGRRAELRAARLGRSLPQARQVLVQKFGVEQVWLFGSLANGTATEHSDVDLAVTGLEPLQYFAALAELMTIFGGPVDLVRLEDATHSLRERVLAEGRKL